MRAKLAPARAAASHSLPFSKRIAHSRNNKRVGARCVPGCKTKLLNPKTLNLELLIIQFSFPCLLQNIMFGDKFNVKLVVRLCTIPSGLYIANRKWLKQFPKEYFRPVSLREGWVFWVCLIGDFYACLSLFDDPSTKSLLSSSPSFSANGIIFKYNFMARWN